ncbi:AMP-binding protein [Xenorhabdus sp. XENO-10]|uniref:AMP-binding protein n=1 Tax=Xenorhabdus yunnanensis TaxID=3025878 RepID=A0ABT5LGF9_9GAMM|nr:AMP-binding protein [Xenorhabdus yunnanensis]MDC9589576.1 AMP-binding protein [Xenorhabdus yunnanensis]
MKPSIINDIVSYPPKTEGNLIVATLSERKTIPLSTLYEMSGCVANGLLAHGIKPGDTIGILSDNRLEWVLLDLAALRIKVRTAGFDPRKFEASAALVQSYQLKCLFTDKPHDASHSNLHDIKEINAFIDEFTEILPMVQYEQSDTTTIKFTSGSTGIPKGLTATVGSIDSSLRSVQNIFNHGDGDRLLVFLPLSLLQQRYWIYSALKFGHDTILTNYQSAFVVMPQLNPTVVMGVPAFFDSARRHIECQSRDLAAMVSQAKVLFGTSIRYLWTGSAPAEVGMLQFFHQVGLPIYEGYGMNETCIVTKNHPAACRLGSVGQVVDEKKVIIDRDGNVVVYSDYPVNTRYLYAQPGASEKMFTADGGVRTGDIGHIDEQGFLYIKGRSDNVIVLDNGKKIDVQPIEARMRNEPAIAECVIFSPKQTELVAIISPANNTVEHASILQALENVNASGEKDEHIARIIIADPPFSIENGLLSSQLKPLRKMIFESYQEQLHATDKESHYAN